MPKTIALMFFGRKVEVWNVQFFSLKSTKDYSLWCFLVLVFWYFFSQMFSDRKIIGGIFKCFLLKCWSLKLSIFSPLQGFSEVFPRFLQGFTKVSQRFLKGLSKVPPRFHKGVSNVLRYKNYRRHFFIFFAKTSWSLKWIFSLKSTKDYSLWCFLAEKSKFEMLDFFH